MAAALAFDAAAANSSARECYPMHSYMSSTASVATLFLAVRKRYTSGDARKTLPARKVRLDGSTAVRTRVGTEENKAERRKEVKKVLAPGYKEIFVAGAKCRAWKKKTKQTVRRSSASGQTRLLGGPRKGGATSSRVQVTQGPLSLPDQLSGHP
jgi:hypothetical protein